MQSLEASEGFVAGTYFTSYPSCPHRAKLW